jgi:pyruvate dehydrogenase E1 component
MGATAGRTTLMGEGLQHQDGHSLLLASTIPACQAYDPAFAFEMAAIVDHGITKMYGPNPADIFYYIALYNENIAMPVRPSTVSSADIINGLYKWAPAQSGSAHASVLFSGTAFRAASEAAEILRTKYNIDVELWSATSYKALREDALETERWNRLHPTSDARTSVVGGLLGDSSAPIIAVSDFMRIVPEQIASFLQHRHFVALGTDGMGRSDTREALRRFFETDSAHVVVAVLSSLIGTHGITAATVATAIADFNIDPDAVHSLSRD